MTKPPQARDMLLAVAAVGGVTVVRLALDSLGNDRSPFVLFALAVVISAFWGGFWSGIAATVLSSVIAVVVFLAPYYSIGVDDTAELVPLVLYLIQGGLISWLGGSNRKALRSLGHLRQQLEERVEQRTAELQTANEQLTTQIGENERVTRELRLFAEQLQVSNRELQDFASVASHDLQEPLRKIQAFGDRLRTRAGDALAPESLDYLSRMQNAANRMQVLINDLLSFSRVTTRAQPFQRVDLATIAEEVISDLEARIDQTGGSVVIENLPTLDADPLQMRQLLQNLISNGLKFRRPGVDPLIRLSSKKLAVDSDEATPLYEICVADNGIGFDEKYLDRIFNIFQRLHGRNEYEGTGIGLAVCRKIVERHGGSITARSAAGEGATFIFTLPARQNSNEISHAEHATA